MRINTDDLRNEALNLIGEDINARCEELIAFAKKEIQSKDKRTRDWEEKRDEHVECLEQMEESLAELMA